MPHDWPVALFTGGCAVHAVAAMMMPDRRVPDTLPAFDFGDGQGRKTL